MKTFLTSDTHFRHNKIIGYSKRPFVTTSEMDATIINNWNLKVGPEDTVFHLGDIVFGPGKTDFVKALLPKLAGRKILIRGNHDRKTEEMLWAGFNEVYDEYWVTVDDRKLYLRHEPLMTFIPDEKADLHMCGHVHEQWTRIREYIENAGVDVCGFTPMTIEELLARANVVGKSHREGYE